MSERTIAAISTPLGEGGIGVIRISGDNAISISERFFKPLGKKKLSEMEGYTAVFGEVYDGDDLVDQGIATVFRGPKSYTGEDVIELSVHGGSYIVKRVLRVVLSSGAEMAEAGEFTKRAFLNRKIDLTQAESIMGIISAQSESALRLSQANHTGKLTRQIEQIKQSLLKTAASIAFYADEPDEEIPELNPENFGKMLGDTILELQGLLSDYDAGKVLREGIETAIVGKPNVGKSTLMNALSGTRRSIVTDIAGTTRDVIEDTVTLGGIKLRLADTAGIHKTKDTVESVGVGLAMQRLNTADLVLAVFDSTQPLDSNDKALIEYIKDKKVIVVINKNDLEAQIDESVFDGFPTVYISAKNKDGLAELTAAVQKITKVANLSADSAVLGSERQRDCAARALSASKAALSALNEGQTIDAVGICIDDAVAALLSLTGQRVTNEVTDEVFKRFCVGK